MRARCTGTTAAGNPCHSPVVGDGGKCYAHANPERWAAAAARGRGRRRPRLPVVVEPCPELETATGLRTFLAGVLNATVSGAVPVPVAHATAQLGNALRQLIESSDLEQRLTALEARAATGPALVRRCR